MNNNLCIAVAGFLIFLLPFLSILMARHTDSSKLDVEDAKKIVIYFGVGALSILALY